MSALVMTELGLQVREGSALAAVLDRELPLDPAAIARRCAWCGEGDPAEAVELVVSHGICPACAEAMRADYRKQTERNPSK